MFNNIIEIKQFYLDKNSNIINNIENDIKQLKIIKNRYLLEIKKDNISDLKTYFKEKMNVNIMLKEINNINTHINNLNDKLLFYKTKNKEINFDIEKYKHLKNKIDEELKIKMEENEKNELEDYINIFSYNKFVN